MHADRVARRKMNPVQRALHTREARPKIADDLIGWRHAVSNTIHNALKAYCRPRQHIDIRLHSGSNVPQLGLSKIPNRPPVARVNQGEDLLAGVGVGSF